MQTNFCLACVRIKMKTRCLFQEILLQTCCCSPVVGRNARQLPTISAYRASGFPWTFVLRTTGGNVRCVLYPSSQSIIHCGTLLCQQTGGRIEMATCSTIALGFLPLDDWNHNTVQADIWLWLLPRIANTTLLQHYMSVSTKLSFSLRHQGISRSILCERNWSNRRGRKWLLDSWSHHVWYCGAWKKKCADIDMSKPLRQHRKFLEALSPRLPQACRQPSYASLRSDLEANDLHHKNSVLSVYHMRLLSFFLWRSDPCSTFVVRVVACAWWFEFATQTTTSIA